MKSRILMVAALMMAVVFLPTTVLLFVGMLPTLVAAITDRSPRKSRAITVGAPNLAGCTPFLIEMWMEGQTIDQAVLIITEPSAIITMYSAAAAGYAIDWAMSGIVASVLYQRGLARLDEIEKRQDFLIQRWGDEVTGRMLLDEDGFPLIARAAGEPGKAAGG